MQVSEAPSARRRDGCVVPAARRPDPGSDPAISRRHRRTVRARDRVGRRFAVRPRCPRRSGYCAPPASSATDATVATSTIASTTNTFVRCSASPPNTLRTPVLTPERKHERPHRRAAARRPFARAITRPCGRTPSHSAADLVRVDRRVLRGRGGDGCAHRLAGIAVRCRPHADRRDRARHGAGGDPVGEPFQPARRPSRQRPHVRRLSARDPGRFRQRPAVVRRGDLGGDRSGPAAVRRTRGDRRADADRRHARTGRQPDRLRAVAAGIEGVPERRGGVSRGAGRHRRFGRRDHRRRADRRRSGGPGPTRWWRC